MTMDEDKRDELLFRLDERTQSHSKILTDINTALHSDFVKKTEFEPVKRLVYGALTVPLLAIIGALVALVLKKT